MFAVDGGDTPSHWPWVMKLICIARQTDDFIARSSDELSLSKGDRVELIERDDEFGDGWFLGRHLVNDNTGLFPEGWCFSPFLNLHFALLQCQLLTRKKSIHARRRETCPACHRLCRYLQHRKPVVMLVLSAWPTRRRNRLQPQSLPQRQRLPMWWNLRRRYLCNR